MLSPSLKLAKSRSWCVCAINSFLDGNLRKLFKSTLNNRLHSNLACVIDKSSRVAKLKRAFEELP